MYLDICWSQTVNRALLLVLLVCSISLLAAHKYERGSQVSQFSLLINPLKVPPPSLLVEKEVVERSCLY